MHTLGSLLRLAMLGILGAAALSAPVTTTAQVVHPPPTLTSLKGVPVPLPVALDNFVKNRTAAILLGKALFWEMNFGSDGQTACATCHFQAGADSRSKNQVSPGLLGGNGAFDAVQSNTSLSGKAGANYQLKKRDFPTHQLTNKLDRNSAALFDSDDVVSSQGVFHMGFKSSNPNATELDDCALLDDPVFSVSGHQTRRVEPRNTPTMINAVFNFRNFWDGRANNRFNGVNPFGDRDRDAGIWENTGSSLAKTRISLENASLASQAVGPPGSPFEMSCGGRMFPDIGRRLLLTRPLYRQAVASTDSVFANASFATDNATIVGVQRHASGKGLKWSYTDYIKVAFADRYWNSFVQVDLSTPLTGGPGTKLYSHMEANMSLFFGLAVMLYESTLVSDDAPLDRFLGNASAPPDPTALSAPEQHGMALFLGKGGCVNCHKGPDLTGAGSGLQRENQEHGLVERMIMSDGSIALYDNGFYNIGVRPAFEDKGVGGVDGVDGKPLSFTRQYIDLLQGKNVPDPLQIDECTFEAPFQASDFPGGAFTAVSCAHRENTPDTVRPNPVPNHPDILNLRIAVNGAFKTPGLRNVELTGPYFHNGSRKSLTEVVEFYNRGGDRRDLPGGDTSGDGASGPNGSNLDAEIKVLGLTAAEQTDLVAFLKRPLTDDRVRCERAPFDHPELTVPNGHPTNEAAVTPDASGKAVDSYRTLSAVGAAGRAAAACLKAFDSGLPN